MFQVGDRVRIENLVHAGHHRVPRYAKGREGRVVAVHPSFPVPDDVVAGIPHETEPVYSVRLESSSVWGPSAEAGSALVLDVWHRFLRPEPGPWNADR